MKDFLQVHFSLFSTNQDQKSISHIRSNQIKSYFIDSLLTIQDRIRKFQTNLSIESMRRKFKENSISKNKDILTRSNKFNRSNNKQSEKNKGKKREKN